MDYYFSVPYNTNLSLHQFAIFQKLHLKIRSFRKHLDYLYSDNLLNFSEETTERYPEILTDEAMTFLSLLHENFNPQRLVLLENRKKQQALFDAGALPTFPAETKNIRESNWRAAAIPTDLLDRRVEITGPVDRKMVINALNSGAKTFMADFEDSTSPTWSNLMTGQQNLKDTVNKTISLEDTVKNKKYSFCIYIFSSFYD